MRLRLRLTFSRARVAAKMRGVLSAGMVLAASNPVRRMARETAMLFVDHSSRAMQEHTHVELVVPPAGSRVGERVSLEGENILLLSPDAEVNPGKDKNPV